MRPDCSLHITPRTGLPSQLGPDQLDIWIHFDAKYKVERIRQDLEPDLDSAEEEKSAADHEASETVKATKREDLLKMHAYRDAIRRTAGAYVLYPGDEDLQVREYHELLPGLGAFNAPSPGSSSWYSPHAGGPRLPGTRRRRLPSVEMASRSACVLERVLALGSP